MACWSFAEYGDQGASILYLNPPYDIDPEYARAEHRWLVHWTDALQAGGILVWIVPHDIMHHSAEHLARHFDQAAAYRFPSADFQGYRQCVLFARKRATPLPVTFAVQDDVIARQVRAWAADATAMPVLVHAAEPIFTAPGKGGFKSFVMGDADVAGALRTLGAMRATDASQYRSLGLDQSIDDLFNRVYPVAMPLRTGHVAQALAAGVLNGRVIAPDQPGLPLLLAKGVFEREDEIVEQKRNKDGDLIANITIQRPKLRLCVLDLTTSTYYDVAPGTTPTGATTLADMTIADVVHAYQTSLIAAMWEQCPPLHDPAAHPAVTLPATPRQPYTAQHHAIVANLKLLAHGKQPFVLGEVGTGKSTIALMTALACSPMYKAAMQAQLGAGQLPTIRNVLILCPPHLLQSWRDQVQAVIPGARVVVLDAISKVKQPPIAYDPDGLPGSGMTIYVLSRESAKLGHGFAAGVHPTTRQCPRCGTAHHDDDAALIKHRTRCTAQRITPGSDVAHLVQTIAHALIPALPHDDLVWQICSGRVMRQRIMRYRQDTTHMPDLSGLAPEDMPWWDTLAGRLVARLIPKLDGYNTPAFEHVVNILMSVTRSDRDACVEATIQRIWEQGSADWYDHGSGARFRSNANSLRSLISDPDLYASIPETWNRTARGVVPGREDRHWQVRMTPDRGLTWDQRGIGDPSFAKALLAMMVSSTTWESAPVCGEPLYQAIPQPRRYPIATYIARHAKDLFDLLILDEAHEYRTDGSAQEHAAHRLMGLGKPTMVMSGSIASGYSSSLFLNLWGLSADFRREFARDGMTTYVTRYGYRKEYVPVSDEEGVQGRGSVTDRIERQDSGARRQLGEAPGVLPVSILRHLLPQGVLIHKGDLDTELPPCQEINVPITADPDQQRAYERLIGRVLDQIKKDRFQSGLAGKLFGALGQVPSYLDRCTSDTGNGGDGMFTVSYPDYMGGALVARGESFDATRILPKEQWMLETLATELDAGRNALLFVAHTDKRTGLVPRLLKLIQKEFGDPIWLDANKVKAADRQAWIDHEIIGRKRRIMLVNPVAVQTGLNNLVWFSRAIWYELIPDAIVWRQANGRVHRIGQTADDVKIHAPYYDQTAQAHMITLLARKVVASMQVDGLDIEGALETAGAGDESNAVEAMALGRAIYELITTQGHNRPPTMIAESAPMLWLPNSATAALSQRSLFDD